MGKCALERDVGSGGFAGICPRTFKCNPTRPLFEQENHRILLLPPLLAWDVGGPKCTQKRQGSTLLTKFGIPIFLV